MSASSAATMPRRAAARLPQPAATADAEVVITGTLLQDAEMRLLASGAAVVTVLVGQRADCPPVCAAELYGVEACSQVAAASKARAMRRGCRVELRGQGLRIGRTARLGAVLKLGQVHRLSPLDLPFDAALAAANDQPVDC